VLRALLFIVEDTKRKERRREGREGGEKEMEGGRKEMKKKKTLEAHRSGIYETCPM
jgi:hypothetical protein